MFFNPVGGVVGLWWPGLVKILMFFFLFFPKLILRHGRQIVLILVIIGGNHKYNFNGEEVIFVPLLMTFQLLAAFQTLDFLQLEAEFIFSLSLRLALCLIYYLYPPYQKMLYW